MDLYSATTAIKRARKRLAHSTRQRAEALTAKAKARHERRVRNAERALAEAEREFSLIALTDG